MEQGPKSQATSTDCSGGVSAVIGASDLDAHTFGSRGASGNQLSCSLPFEAERPIVGTVWQAQPHVCDERQEARGSISSGRRSSEPTTPSRDFLTQSCTHTVGRSPVLRGSGDFLFAPHGSGRNQQLEGHRRKHGGNRRHRELVPPARSRYRLPRLRVAFSGLLGRRIR